MSWLISFVVAVLSGVVGCVGAGGVALLCVDWYRVPQREGAAGYFVVFVGLFGAVGGLALGLVLARVAHGAWGPGFLREGAVALGGVVVVLAVVLGLCRVLRPGAEPAVVAGLDLLVEVRLPPECTEFPAKDAAEAYLGLAMVDGRTREQREERAGRLEVDRARLDQGRWLVPGRASIASVEGEVVLTVKVGPAKAERFLLPLASAPVPTERWSDWIPRGRPEGGADGGAAMNTMTFRYRVRRAEG